MGATSELINRERQTIVNDLVSIMLFGAVGTDPTAFDPTDTALGNEILRKAVVDVDTSTPGRINVSTRISTTEANGSTLAEEGIFVLSSGGSMYLRNTFNLINKTSDINVYLDNRVDVTVSQTDGGTIY